MYKLELQTTDNITHITSKELFKNDIFLAFTTRKTGLSPKTYDSLNLGFHVDDDQKNAAQNRILVSKTFNYNAEDLTCAQQVHGNKVKFVAQNEKGAGGLQFDTAIAGIDGLAVDGKSFPIAMFFADCLPVVVISLDPKIVAIVHAGYKGLLNNIIECMVEITRQKTEPGKMLAFLGPAIGPCCYEVEAERINKFHANFPNIVRKNDKALDLKKIAIHQLESCGIGLKNIYNADYCTSCNSELFYSFRKEEVTGRQAAIAFIRG